MKHPGKNPLLREILADDPLAALRHRSLEAGLSEMRRANRFRRAARAGALLLLAALLVLKMSPRPPAPLQASLPPAIASAKSAEPRYTKITDDELFALFPGRPLAIIGEPGHQRLVFLDTAANR